jgi:hypothetical protein
MQRRAPPGAGGRWLGSRPALDAPGYPRWRATHHKRERVALSSRECLQQRPGLLEVCRVKALGEPVIDGRQQGIGFGAFPLLLPQAAQAHSGAQLPGFGLLPAGNGQGLLEAGFGLGGVRDRLLLQQDALEAIRLRQQVALLAGLELR